MALILCIETATTNCSVALARDGEMIALKEDNSKNYSHAEKLHIFIQEVVEENGFDLKDLEAIAISKGPGSYTGLRIGVSAAKGLCFSLDIPLISVPTLKVLAQQVQPTNETDLIVPMLDARRMEVYSVVFDAAFQEQRKTLAEVLSEDSFSEYLQKGKVYFIGSGVEKFKNICDHPNAVFFDDRFPSAREMCSLASAKYEKSDTEDVAYFEPYYLKDFIAG